MTLTVFLRKLISSNYGIVILGIPLLWFKFKGIFQYISNPDLSPYFYMPINYSAKIAFHLPKSNSLTFLPTPLDMPSLPPPSAVTEDGGTISPVTHAKTLASFLPLSFLIALTLSRYLHTLIYYSLIHQQCFLNMYYTLMQQATNKNMTDSASRTS